jgi:hypothetical protein
MTAMMRRGLTIMLSTLLVLGAVASAGAAALTFLGLTFPERVADTQIGPARDFETTNPGLGYGVKYEKPGWAIDVFIYDLRRTSIPDDVGSDVLKAQIEQAQGDIFEQQKKGAYQQVEVARSYVVNDSRGRGRLLCADFSYVRQPEGSVDSFLCLAGWHNKFVKFRLTTRQNPRSSADARRFVDAWVKILWP